MLSSGPKKFVMKTENVVPTILCVLLVSGEVYFSPQTAAERRRISRMRSVWKMMFVSENPVV